MPSKPYSHPEERPKGASRRTPARYAALRPNSCPASQRLLPLLLDCIAAIVLGVDGVSFRRCLSHDAVLDDSETETTDRQPRSAKHAMHSYWYSCDRPRRNILVLVSDRQASRKRGRTVHRESLVLGGDPAEGQLHLFLIRVEILE
jgi:hypothetical protein